MPVTKCCICHIALGGESCDSTTGIAELYYISPCLVNAITFNPVASGCCDKGQIASFGLDFADPLNPAPEELLQPITFVNQDDDSGAVFTRSTVSDGGSKQRNRTLPFQVEANTPEQECAIDAMVNQEVAFVIKYKNGNYRLVNYSGGMRVISANDDSNTSYTEVTLSGRPNDRDLLIDPTWAAANIVPQSLNPGVGLVNE